ncbi:MAG: substrate-binding domain-containing protein [Clostridiales bacterium]
MAKLQNILIALLVATFIVVFIITIRYIKEIESEFNYNINIENCFNYGDKYHFAFISPDIDNTNWVKVKKGALNIAKENDLSIEFKGSNEYSVEEQKKYMDIAINSKIDGIILYVTNEEEIIPYIDMAVEKGIPVITMGKEAVKSKRLSYIAIPNYKTGVEAANELISFKEKEFFVSVIIGGNGENKKEEEISENVIYDGFKNTIKDYNNIKIDQIYVTKNLLDTNKITRDIIKEENSNTIFCIGMEETVIAVHTIIDLNSVNRFTTIGLGDDSEILRLIDNGIIRSSIVDNKFKVGYQAIEQLINIREANHISEFVDVSVDRINKNNIKKYIDKK